MIVDYCGLKIAYTEFDVQDYKWALFDEHENFVGLIEHQEYINHPTLYTIGNSYGRYRKSNPSLCGGSFGNSSNPITSGASISFTINPGTGTLIPFGTLIPLTKPSGWVTIPPIPRDDTPIEDAGIRAGEIIAHRCWWLLPGNRLFSIYMHDYEWMPGVSATGDVKRDGVHAFKYEWDVYAYGAEMINAIRYYSFMVSGTVKLWGEIVEHERGYRAEFAKIASLNTNNIHLKHRYGVLD